MIVIVMMMRVMMRVEMMMVVIVLMKMFVITVAMMMVLIMTTSQINPSYECGKWMKVKVAKWCWKKWNGPILMHIYDKQCEIMQKNQWKGPNFQTWCFYNGRSLSDRSSLLKRRKQGRLKRILLKILNRYDPSRVGPCESWRPEDSKNVVLFEIWRF